MDFKGFTISQSTIEVDKIINKKKEKYSKVFRTLYEQNNKKTGKMSIKRLTKLSNNFKKYYANHFKNQNDINVVFKIAGSGNDKTMVLKNFINIKNNEEIKNIADYFDDFDWYNNHEKFINDDIENSINNFNKIWFDCYVEFKNKKAPGDGNLGPDGFCFYNCLAECGIIQRYKNYENEKGEKHEMGLYEELIIKINSYNDNKLNLDGTVNTSDIPIFERHFDINIYVNGQKIGNKQGKKGNIWLKFSNNHFYVDYENQRKGKENIYNDIIYFDGKKYKTKKIMQNKYNPKSERNLIVVKSATTPEGNKIIYYYDKTGFKKVIDNKENRNKIYIMGYVVEYGQNNINIYKKESEELITDEEKKIINAEKLIKKNKNEKFNSLPKDRQKSILNVIKKNKMKEEEKTIEIRLKYVYDNYKKEIENIKKYLNIDLLHYKSTSAFLNIHLNNYIKMLTKNYNFESISDYNEYKWLKYGMSGAINYLTNKTDKIYDVIYQYDIKSAYPACMIDKNFKFPIKQGTFAYKNPKYFIQDVKNRKLKYGIYHCIIEPNNNKNIYFMFNDDKKCKKGNKKIFPKLPNYYTHYDIYLAYEQGLKIELIDEEKAEPSPPDALHREKNNCLVYNNNILVDGESIFKNFYQDLFYYRKILKEKKQPTALLKSLISSLHGRISEEGKGYVKEYEKDGNNLKLTLKEDEFYCENEYDKNNINYCFARVINKQNLTYNKLYRLHPFLLSYQKLHLYTNYIKEIESEKIEIVKIVTDGIYTTEKIKKYDDNYNNCFVGDLVPEIEYYKDVKFINKTTTNKKKTLKRSDLIKPDNVFYNF